MGFRLDQKEWVKLADQEIRQLMQVCRPIPTWHNRWFSYWISDDGKDLFFIKNKPINAMCKEIVNHRHPIHLRNGYPSTKLIRYESTSIICDWDECYICTSEYKSMQIHILVALAWISDKPEGCTLVRHLDGDKFHNRHTNLAWGSIQDNADDAKWHNKVGKGKPESVRPECRDLPHRLYARSQGANV